MGRWDLHLHSRWSDGSLPVEKIVSTAIRQGLSGISITDHDSMAMLPRAKAAAGDALTIISGVELSSYDPDTGRKVHLLVYEPQDTAPLHPLFRLMRERRQQAGELAIRSVCSLYPVEPARIHALAAESETVFRVHILHALMEIGCADAIYGKRYLELFGDDGCCMHSTRYPSIDMVAEAARETGGALILAHPGVYDSFAVAERLAQAGLLDGIEMVYPRCTPAGTQKQLLLQQRYSLLGTGGTDFHGWYAPIPYPIGTATVGDTAIEALLACCSQ